MAPSASIVWALVHPAELEQSKTVTWPGKRQQSGIRAAYRSRWTWKCKGARMAAGRVPCCTLPFSEASAATSRDPTNATATKRSPSISYTTEGRHSACPG